MYDVAMLCESPMFLIPALVFGVYVGVRSIIGKSSSSSSSRRKKENEKRRDCCDSGTEFVTVYSVERSGI